MAGDLDLLARGQPSALSAVGDLLSNYLDEFGVGNNNQKHLEPGGFQNGANFSKVEVTNFTRSFEIIMCT